LRVTKVLRGVITMAILEDTELKKLIEGLRHRIEYERDFSVGVMEFYVKDVTDLCDTVEAMDKALTKMLNEYEVPEDICDKNISSDYCNKKCGNGYKACILHWMHTELAKEEDHA
jgi:hypothetical protein